MSTFDQIEAAPPEDDQTDDQTSDELDDVDETTDELDDDQGEDEDDGKESDPPSDDDSSAPEWTRNLRKQHLEMSREMRRLKSELEQAKGQQHQAPKITDPGPKPRMQDFDWDSDVYEQKLEEWHKAKTAAEAHKAQADQELAQAQQKMAEAGQRYAKAKRDMIRDTPDFELAEDAAAQDLSELQGNIIMAMSKDSAKLVYKIGKDQALRKSISSIKDPLLFAYEIGKLETAGQKSMKPQKTPPAPEKRVASGGVSSGATRMDKLEAAASKSGDRTAIIRAKQAERARSLKQR